MKNKYNKITTLTKRYTPSFTTGLSSLQVKERIEQGLKNDSTQKYSKSYLSIFAGNVFTFFNLLGLIVFISLLVSGTKTLSNYVFVLVYLANATIGIVQEIRAKKSIDRLTLITSRSTTVVRDGKETDVSPSDVVLDDVIKLSVGNQIPTDGIILDGAVEVNESLLTGESIPLKKKSGDALLSGSFIVSGNCYMRADKVGSDNYVETLSSQAKIYKKPKSELMNTLRFFIKTIGIIIIPLAVAYMLKSTLYAHKELSDAIARTSALVIGMIPSGMFLLTSLALAVGIIKLAKRNTMVNDLYSLEMLARVDTVCFDKTGTLTDGNMVVSEVIPLNGTDIETIENAIRSILFATKDDNHTACALAERFGRKKCIKAVYTLPFSSERKLSLITSENGYTYTLGAPEFVLTNGIPDDISETVDEHASKGNRVIILALSKEIAKDGFIPKDNVPLALIALSDNIRKEATQTVKWFNDNGVTIKVISGDNPLTVSEISKRAGVIGAENYISLEGLSDEEVKDAADKYNVFGRVLPDQKALLIKSLKEKGRVTAMTGDGVNDILAMKEADCAVSVATGSDAARNIAHIVLMDNNFNNMPQVVFEGRRVINNVKSSSSLYLMKTFFTMLMAICSLIIPYMKVYPFQLSQMNIMEIFVIGIPSFFLALQPNDSIVKGKFLTDIVTKSIPSALLMLINVMAIEIVNNALGGVTNEETIRSFQIFALTFAGVVNLFIISMPFNKYRTVLFVVSFILIAGIFTFTVINGLAALQLERLSVLFNAPLFFCLLPALIIIDFPLYYLFRKIVYTIINKK